ncbi:DUF1905 domain-containing protein [Kineococcus glutinatus]|uniref:DUF1905 domain-containing protein n=1 Tax=Kineococcus glutinatus TaxID=1070872 RepID=A0ABP9H3P7_9ACTN
MRYEFTAELWRWEARPDLWVFVRLPADVSAEIRDVPRPRSGFGAVPVRVACGGSRWSTSVFPESADGAYVLPVKKAVRDGERLALGDRARFVVEVLG